MLILSLSFMLNFHQLFLIEKTFPPCTVFIFKEEPEEEEEENQEMA